MLAALIPLVVELLPVIGPVTSVIGMVTDAVAPPSPAGAMGGLATTIAVFNWLRPRINKLVDWTDTKYDNIAWNWFTTIMGWVIKISRLDWKNVEGKKKGGK